MNLPKSKRHFSVRWVVANSSTLFLVSNLRYCDIWQVHCLRRSYIHLQLTRPEKYIDFVLVLHRGELQLSCFCSINMAKLFQSAALNSLSVAMSYFRLDKPRWRFPLFMFPIMYCMQLKRIRVRSAPIRYRENIGSSIMVIDNDENRK